MDPQRHQDLIRFYSLLNGLETRSAVRETLPIARAACHGRPAEFISFARKVRSSDSGSGPRIVRVGTHALKDASGTKLWTRLSQQPVFVAILAYIFLDERVYLYHVVGASFILAGVLLVMLLKRQPVGSAAIRSKAEC